MQMVVSKAMMDERHRLLNLPSAEWAFLLFDKLFEEFLDACAIPAQTSGAITQNVFGGYYAVYIWSFLKAISLLRIHATSGLHQRGNGDACPSRAPFEVPLPNHPPRDKGDCLSLVAILPTPRVPFSMLNLWVNALLGPSIDKYACSTLLHIELELQNIFTCMEGNSCTTSGYWMWALDVQTCVV